MGRIFTVGVEILKSNRTGHPAFTAADRTVRMELKMSLKNENGRSLVAEIYKNTKMGADSITDLIGHVKDGELRLEMTAELDRYEELASRAAKLTREKGEEPKEEGALTRAAAKMSMAVNTMSDPSASHIAEMMIQGADMGVTGLRRAISAEEECPSPDREAMALAKETVSFEEGTVEKLKAFL